MMQPELTQQELTQQELSQQKLPQQELPQPRLPHNHGQNTEQVCSKLPPFEDFKTVSELFRQLSDGNRLRIFWLLCHCEECVINISTIVGMSSPAVSHHLKQLRSSGLILSHRDGKEVYYKAADTSAAQLLHDMLEKLMVISCPAT